jgi:hypothetical protein
VPIRKILWTVHAERRLRQRVIATAEVEAAVRGHHEKRQINRGPADWRVEAATWDGRQLVVIYDCPVFGDRETARVVSAWTLRINKRGTQGYSGS